MPSNREADSFSEALFFGVLEVVCFSFLFLSPQFLDATLKEGWYALVIWRVACLGGVFHLGLYESWKKRIALISRKALYGTPFWFSSLLFPLRAGQEEMIANALVTYVVLTAVVFLLSFLPTHWYPALLGSMTLWGLHGDVGAERWWIVVMPLFAAAWPRGDRSTELDYGWARGTVLLATAAWALAIFVGTGGRGLGLLALAESLIVWVVATLMIGDVLHRARQDERSRRWRHEAEVSLPALEAALGWRYRRGLSGSWLPWMVVLPLALGSITGLELVLVLATVLVGVMVRVGSRTTTEASLSRWTGWTFVVLWVTVEGHQEFWWLGLAMACVVSLTNVWSTRRRPQLQSEAIDLAYRSIERQLRTGLMQTAPVDTKQRVLEKQEARVDIDDRLTASAPTGFRERLLERLQSDPLASEGDD